MNYRLLLLPFSYLFAGLIWLRNKFYDFGMVSSNDVPALVVCVGNISAGGTGKTPWVQWLSRSFETLGYKHCILSRGYSGDFDGVLEVDDAMDPRKCGDEPLWLKRNTSADVFVGRNRTTAARTALGKADYQCLLLDDGFQHRALARDIDIVLLDASSQSRYDYPLPSGLMREGYGALRRASYVIINKCNYGTLERVDFLKKQAHRYMRPDQIFSADFVFQDWLPLFPELHQEMNLKLVCLSCGVGNPRAFEKTVKTEGITPKRSFIYPDHYYWKPSDIEKMTYHMQQLSSRDLIITEKDAVKLVRYRKHFQEMGIQLWVCKMVVELQEGDAAFFETLKKSLQDRELT